MDISIDDAKQAAQALRASLAAQGTTLSHSAALEHLAHATGYRDWNTMVARLRPRPRSTTGGLTLSPAIPILRIFDVAKAREFYMDFLGFALDWEHRYAPDLPLYLQISRSGLVLHLSEHHGDGTPGTVVYCPVRGVRALHAELIAKQYRYYRPGLEVEPDAVGFSLEDGFGNGLRFSERTA